MDVKELAQRLGLSGQQSEPAYATVPTTPLTSSTATFHDLSDADMADAPSATSSSRIQLPSRSRFLADFTLGFADGLTVPFALTAGLSSLGQTNTVILAGMAEIAAGSISMGIGGYLSAKGDSAVTATTTTTTTTTTSADGAIVQSENPDPEKAANSDSQAVVEDYLARLRLPQNLLESVRSHVHRDPSIVQMLGDPIQQDDEDEDKVCSPVLNGLSVALGYLLGGSLPLFPYFFVNEVEYGLKYSFAVCVLALFVFGFTKHYLLQEDIEDKSWSQAWDYHSRRWNRIKQSAWEGLQMVVLGSIAAVAAVLCVKASEHIVS